MADDDRPFSSKPKEPQTEEERLAAAAFDNNTSAVNDVCEANGVTRDVFISARHTVDTLDLYYFNFDRMQGLHFFKSLKKLVIMQQDISVIEGLDELQQLEDLWLCESQITKIQGLDHCTSLKQLFLYENKISKIENLQNLTNLEVLWLHDNQISEIENLEGLVNLRVLWLANNKIEHVRTTLECHTRLEELNLAANRIGCFKEIPYLQRIPSLRSLSFADPHFGENPVCSLCNYQTYALYHLSQITALDAMVVTEEQRHLAEATFVKKRMYYNMRIKTLKRNTTNVLRKASRFRQARVAHVNLSLNVLLRLRKEVERELDEIRLAEQNGDEQRLSLVSSSHIRQLETKLESASQCIAQKYAQIQALHACYDVFRDKVINISDRNISRLLVELDTGGNIRLEEGKPTDVWYHSCVDLVKSRFAAPEFESEFGITGIRITRVTRIYNRYLKTRFESKLETLVDTSNPAYKKQLEYLFFGTSPQLPGEIPRVMEDGFRLPREYENMGLDGAIPLTNSMAITDGPRIRAVAPAAGSPKNEEVLKGQLLIVKVFLGKCAQEPARSQPPPPSKPKGITSPSSAASRASASRPGTSSGASSFSSSSSSAAADQRIKHDQYGDLQSIFRMKAGDQKQRTWFVFDNALVLPEYHVEFEYTSRDSSDEHMDMVEDIVAELQPQTDTDAIDIRSFAPSFAKMVLECNALSPFPAENVPYDETCASILSMPPTIQPRAKIFVMLPENIQNFTKSISLSSITYLNLTGNSIRKMENLSAMPNLRILILSFNEIQKIEGLGDLSVLERLDMGFNLIKRIEGFKPMPSLKILELNNNLIYRLEDINLLKRYVSNLTDLNLRNNAICEAKSYRYNVLRRLTQLSSLDGQAVTDRERVVAIEKMSAITHELLHQHASWELRNGWGGSASLSDAFGVPLTAVAAPVSAASSSSSSVPPASPARSPAIVPAAGNAAGGGVPSPSAILVDLSWTVRVQELDLNRMRIRKIQNLDRLINLRRASFMDNEISRIEGLEALTRLEELNLEENRIVKIEGLSTLVNLKKLELGKNKISRIEGLDTLVALTQLSLEDNDLHSVAGLNKLVHLYELYMGNNKVEGIKEINHLRELQKLIILDLSGNPLCADADYRLFTVYTVKKLKVLDGLSVDSGEVIRAKETFSGKMSTDLLAERVNGIEFAAVTELNLSSCGIREVSLLDEFVSLRSLILDNNQIIDLNGLFNLTSLISLRCNNNRIETPSTQSARGPAGPSSSSPMFARWFDNLSNLEILQLGHNQINNIAFLNLSRVTNLKSLDLQANEISKVDGLDNLSNLRELNLDKNKIRFLDERAFAFLINLRELHIEENSLRTLEAARALPKLQVLLLGCNRILDLAEIEKLCVLENLVEVVLALNPVSRKPMYRPQLIFKLPSLQIIDGKEVAPEERERVEQTFAPQEYHYPNMYDQRAMALQQMQMQMQMAQVQAMQQPAIGSLVAGKVPFKVSAVNFDYQDGAQPQLVSFGSAKPPQPPPRDQRAQGPFESSGFGSRKPPPPAGGERQRPPQRTNSADSVHRAQELYAEYFQQQQQKRRMAAAISQPDSGHAISYSHGPATLPGQVMASPSGVMPSSVGPGRLGIGNVPSQPPAMPAHGSGSNVGMTGLAAGGGGQDSRPSPHAFARDQISAAAASLGLGAAVSSAQHSAGRTRSFISPRPGSTGIHFPRV